MKRIFLSIIAVLTIFISEAQTISLTLDQCFEMAAIGNPSLRIAEMTVDRAEVFQGTAFDIPYTGVTLKQETTAGGTPDNGLVVSQEFEFPTVYIARGKALRAETEVERRRLDEVGAAMARDVASVYFELAHARRTIEILEQRDTLYNTYARLSAERQANGQSSRLEALNVEMSRRENQASLSRARDTYRNASLKLASLLGIDGCITPADELTPLSMEIPADTPPADNSFSARIADSELTAAQKRLAVERNAFLPSISVSATSQVLIKGFNPYNVERKRFKGNFLAFEVGVSVPLFFGAQRARTRAAIRDVKIAETMAGQARLDSSRLYAEALAAFRTATANLATYTELGGRTADEIERLARVSYELGEIDYHIFIENLDTALGARLSLADAVRDFNLAAVNLKYHEGL